jgi:hypothetical protein
MIKCQHEKTLQEPCMQCRTKYNHHDKDDFHLALSLRKEDIIEEQKKTILDLKNRLFMVQRKHARKAYEDSQIVIIN